MLQALSSNLEVRRISLQETLELFSYPNTHKNKQHGNTWRPDYLQCKSVRVCMCSNNISCSVYNFTAHTQIIIHKCLKDSICIACKHLVSSVLLQSCYLSLQFDQSFSCSNAVVVAVVAVIVSSSRHQSKQLHRTAYPATKAPLSDQQIINSHY